MPEPSATANKDGPPPRGSVRRRRSPTRSIAELVGRRELYPLNEAAHLLGISRATLYRRFRDGDIQQLNVNGRGYISDAEIKRYVATLEADARRAAIS